MIKISRYGQALGVLEFTVGGLDFKLRPKKGDNLELLDIQSKAGKDHAKLMRNFVPYMTKIVSREDDLAAEDKEELEIFIEQNVMDFFKEIMIAFRWTTREKMEEAEAKTVQDFQAAVTNEN